jgi:hypothetical protein
MNYFLQVEYRKELLNDFVKAKHKLLSLDNTEFNESVSVYDQKNLNGLLKVIYLVWKILKLFQKRKTYYLFV